MGRGGVGRITTSIDAVMNPGAAGMIVMSLPEMTLVPGAQRYTDGNPALAAPISAAIDVVNSSLRQEVLARGLVFVDAASAMRDFNAAPLVIGGVNIDTTTGNTKSSRYSTDMRVHSAPTMR